MTNDNKSLRNEDFNNDDGLDEFSKLSESLKSEKESSSSGFHKGDTMVLVADYTEDSDYSFYIDMESDKSSSGQDTSEKSDENINEEDREKEKLSKSKEEIFSDEKHEGPFKLNSKNKNSSKNKVVSSDNKKKHRKIAVFALCIILLITGLLTYRYNKIKVFPEGTVFNKIEVAGLSVDKASAKLDNELNTVTIIKDGEKIGKADTLFKFESQKAMKKALRKSAINPYYIYKSIKSESVDIPLKVVEGVDQTVPNLLNLDKANSKVDQTKDAYIDLEKCEIVPEHQGKNVDYSKISKAIAKQHYDQPSKLNYKFKSASYYKKPKIKAKDLGDELKFVKENIMQGLDVETPRGVNIHVEPKDLAKIIKYSKDGAVYSKEGADEVAKSVVEIYNGNRSEIKINTTKGERSVINYDFTSEADVKQTAQSIYEAAKNKTTAKLITSKGSNLDLKNRLEVDLSNQTITLVTGGESKGIWPIVSGGPGHRTPPGLFAIKYKTSPAVLRGLNDDGSKYASPVNYWMPFNGGIGVHDADGWMRAYGGNIYVYGGSHGCINVSTSGTRTIYNNVSAGTPVIVHY